MPDPTVKSPSAEFATSTSANEVAGHDHEHQHAHAVDGERCGTESAGCDGHGGCGGGGGCGSHGAAYVPVLDARQIDPAIRQSAIFGVLVGLPPAQAVTVITDQDPAPITELLQDRLPGEYEVSADQAPDEAYQVTFARI